MELSHILLLALVQALAEFLPISSSGHLGLVGFLFGWAYQGVTFDLALHFGTLMAVLVYYRRDLTAEEAHLVDRHMADVEALLRVVVGIVRRAVARRVAL